MEFEHKYLRVRTKAFTRMPKPFKKTNLMVRLYDKGLFIIIYQSIKRTYSIHSISFQVQGSSPQCVDHSSAVDSSSAVFLRCSGFFLCWQQRNKISFKLKSINASWGACPVSHYPLFFLFLSTRRLPGSPASTITFMLPARDSDVLSLGADWVSLC